MRDSNPRHLRCKRSALPAELIAPVLKIISDQYCNRQSENFCRFRSLASTLRSHRYQKCPNCNALRPDARSNHASLFTLARGSIPAGDVQSGADGLSLWWLSLQRLYVWARSRYLFQAISALGRLKIYLDTVPKSLEPSLVALPWTYCRYRSASSLSRGLDRAGFSAAAVGESRAGALVSF